MILVTGLPRSGTSLLMALLQAGGVRVLSDDRRPPDQHNPRGYFEHQAVLDLAADASWLWKLEGQAVKILSRQMEFVPPQLPARVLLLERDLVEVSQSQQRMLGQPSPDLDWPIILQKELRRLKGWLARQSWPLLLVQHRRLLQEPEQVGAELQDFLNFPLDLKAMAAQVDLNLYRNRAC
ncbi:hypothetical protein ABS71_06760 [bacterium SCN 62-11]|nr:MAG: hypothetical protein ABS71_06760 [bacterium SCN 62-11]